MSRRYGNQETMTDYSLEWPLAYPPISLNAKFKLVPEDFKVYEELPFQCSGEGEHFYLEIEKTNANTSWVAERLANWAHVSQRSVSYAGLKDRHGVTVQWFSIQLPGKTLPESDPGIEGVKVLRTMKHNRKLKRGAISKNDFEIRLRDVNCAPVEIEKRIKLIESNGVPNYYGQQRFGQNQDNVAVALKKLSRKVAPAKRSILLSSLRSYIFNKMLGLRISNGQWRQPQIGQPMILSGSRSWFESESVDLEVERISQKDCSPAIPLYREHESFSEMDQPVLAECLQICQKINTFRMEQAVRACILWPGNMKYRLEDGDLVLNFSLPTGSYATSVLREIISGFERQDMTSEIRYEN